MRGLYEELDELLPDGRSPETLVIYVYSASDTEYARNLHFFVRNGMWEGDGCDYVIVVQQVCILSGNLFLRRHTRRACIHPIQFLMTMQGEKK
jgi:hypothetical protein